MRPRTPPIAAVCLVGALAFAAACASPLDQAVDLREDDPSDLRTDDALHPADLRPGGDLRGDLAPTSLCMPPGNLLAEGALDQGLSGLAPVGFTVRSPGQPERCKGSGTPAQHLYASPPAPGCAGGAITIDARGEWDCYAVQGVSPYNSIQGGARYVIRAVTRSSGNAINPAAWFFLGVQWVDAMDRFFGDEKNPRPAPEHIDHGWQITEWELVAPAQARRILLWLTAHHPGKVEFDHIGVYRAPG